jgi:hypothetical protein
MSRQILPDAKGLGARNFSLIPASNPTWRSVLISEKAQPVSHSTKSAWLDSRQKSARSMGAASCATDNADRAGCDRVGEIEEAAGVYAETNDADENHHPHRLDVGQSVQPAHLAESK